MRILLPLVLCAAVAGTAVGHDTTRPDVDRARQTVRLKDLDLSSPADVERLYLRVRRAVEALCPAPTGDVARFMQGRACQQEVLQRAVDGAGIPQLVELHRERSGAAGDRLARR